MRYMTENQIQSLAEDALNVACKHMQDALGVTQGDFAGLFFGFDDQVQKIFAEYIRGELNEL